jgi:hypothetical protein
MTKQSLLSRQDRKTDQRAPSSNIDLFGSRFLHQI